jgi:Tfp pilus assembly protein PilZ
MGSLKNCKVTAGNCPYWSISNKSCVYGRGGLYLPVAEHILTYCRTPNYASCSLLEGQLVVNDQGGVKEDFQDRRGYERVPGRFTFKVSNHLRDEDLVSLVDDKAVTVDISQGGIRFETFREVPVDSLISFFLTAKEFEEPLHGVGQVKWCKPLEKSSAFHAGIAFTDASAPSAVRNRLGIIDN